MTPLSARVPLLEDVLEFSVHTSLSLPRHRSGISSASPTAPPRYGRYLGLEVGGMALQSKVPRYSAQGTVPREPAVVSALCGLPCALTWCLLPTRRGGEPTVLPGVLSHLAEKRQEGITFGWQNQCSEDLDLSEPDWA